MYLSRRATFSAVYALTFFMTTFQIHANEVVKTDVKETPTLTIHSLF